MTIFEYIRLNAEARAEVLLSKGVFMESYADLGSSIDVYYLSSFFVEVTLDKDKNITDITPFRRGYRTNKYKDDVNTTATA
ncbi:MAG: hypothetical protein ACYDCN_00425 [Bacteroidia bacterium]